jgi:hypothetical protein
MTIDALQFEIFSLTKSATKEIKLMITLLKEQLKDRKVSVSRKQLIKNDIVRLRIIQQQMRELEIMTGFYSYKR